MNSKWKWLRREKRNEMPRNRKQCDYYEKWRRNEHNEMTVENNVYKYQCRKRKLMAERNVFMKRKWREESWNENEAWRKYIINVEEKQMKMKWKYLKCQ
jgi:hypothetical protein